MISKLREKMGKSSVIMMLFFATFVTALILSFNAVADIDAFKIVGAEVSARDTGVSGDVTNYDADTIESDTVFHHVGDTITYNLSVKNQHDKKYKIITITDDNNNPSVLYNYNKHEGEEVAGGASFDLVVTAEYASGVASLNDRAQHLSVRFMITYEEVTNPDPDPTPTPTPSDEGDSSNPNTGDRLPIYITVLIASMIGLIVCIWRIGHDRSGRKKHYNGRKIIVCLLIASALIPVAAKALTEASDFVLVTDYEFMDQLEITMEVDGTESVTPIAYGSTVGTLPVPSKDNFGFVGWKDESNNLLPNDTVLTEDTKLTAVFERVSINAHFTHNNETTGEYVVEVPINSTLGSNIPAGPSYAGHVFDNWYTLADGGDAVDANTQVYETDVTYYAHWLNDITSATANPDTMELFFDVDVAAEKTQSFTIVGSNLENYTISSSDESVATVSGNTVTGVSEGTANIIITGTGSHEQKTIITVTVVSGMRNVNFYYNDGTENKITVAVHVNSTIGNKVPAGPSREHYDFDGWYTLAEGGVVVDGNTVVGTEDADCYAHWTVNKHNVSFSPNYENAPAAENILVDWNTTIGSEPTAITREHYTFDGWYDDATAGTKITSFSNIVITEDTTYYAHWTVDQHVVTFSPNYENAPAAQTMTVDWNTQIGAEPTAITREHYTLDGWYDAPTNGNKINSFSDITITEDTTYYAYWTIDKHTVTFSPNYENAPTAQTMQVDWNTTIGSEPTSITRAHYTFDGWYDDATAGTKITGFSNIVITADTTYYAHWIVDQHTVTFSPNYENAPDAETMTVDWNAQIGAEPTTITRAHYAFDGWYDAPTGGNEISNFSGITITADTTYYAHWTIDKHTVTFSPNYENAPTAQTMQVDWNTQIGSEPTAITREHYALDGWYDAPTNGNKINSFSGITITGDTTYYAHWTLTTATITFVYQNGATPDRETRSVNSGDTIDSFPAITYEGFNLIGWFDDPTGGNEVDTNTVVNSDITVYAHWGAILCKKTTEMHVHTCDRSDSGSASGCKQAGYAQNDIITFGNIASSTLTPGDAYDCDMNGNGVFGDADPTTGESTERFYYLRTIDNDRAALIFYANYEGVNGPGSAQQFTFGEIDTALPSSSVWSNAAISFNGNPSRIPLKADIIEACGSNSGNNYSVASCEYILENTAFVSSDTNYYQNGVWVENNTNRYMGHTLRLISGSTNKNGVRPVIEVPLVQMEQSYHIEYDVGDGTLLTGSQHDFIAKGSAMGTLPTFAKTDYISDGWYTANGEAVDENYVPTADMTLYAHYKNSVAQAVIANPNISVNVGETEQIVITNASEIGEAYIFTPSDQTIVDVTTNGGLVTGTGEGDTTITLVGITSGRSKVINVHVILIRDYYIVNLNENGGDPISATYNPLRVPKDNAVSAAQNLENGDFPTTQYSGHNFDGWYADSNCNIPVSLSTVVSEDTTYYAKWISVNAIAEVVKSDGTHQYPETIAALNTSIDNSSGTTNVTILKDITLTNPAIIINAGHDVILDLNEHTLSHPSTSGFNVIQNWGTALVKNGTITSNANKKGAVDCNDDGVLILEDLTILHTNNRQAVYNNGGDITIRGNSYFHNTASNDTSRRGTVQNHFSDKGNGGTIRILSGTIVAENQSAVKVEAGTTVIIGTAGDGVDTTAPVIQGKIYGVETAGTVEFYDGIIKGYSAATDNTNGITTETSLVKTIGSEIIDGLQFETMYLVPAP